MLLPASSPEAFLLRQQSSVNLKTPASHQGHLKPQVARHALPVRTTQGNLLTQTVDTFTAVQKAKITPKSIHKSAIRFTGGLGSYPFDNGDIQLGTHPTDSPYYNQLDAWRKKIWHEATRPRPGFTEGWLQPMDTLFQMASQIDLMEAAARSGFPTRFRHWSWGQDFNEQYQRQRFGLGRLYEMVINTNPSYAFLYDRNPVYAQKVVMAHVLGHTDFFKNNLMFSETNRNMVRVMADNKAKIERYYADPWLTRHTVDGVHPVEKFLNQFNSLEWLVDLSALKPPSLEALQKQDIASSQSESKVAQALTGLKADFLGAAPWMQDFLYSHQDWKKDHDKTQQEADAQQAKPVPNPTRDVLGVLLTQGQGLKPWQKDMLANLREESYYFVPQVRTKLMNEGWATFWHHKLMSDSPNLIDESETADIAQMMAGVESPPPEGINPYQVGYAIFKNIYEHAGYGLNDFDTTFQPNRVIRQEDWHHRMNPKNFNEVAALKQVQDVRKYLNDVDFIRQYFTPEVAEQLGMVVTQEREEWDRNAMQEVKVKYVESDAFNQVKELILQQYENIFPSISVMDANHNGKGELLMKHENPIQDLDLADTRETLANLSQFWGKPVHLDSTFEAEVGETKPKQQSVFWGSRADEKPKGIHERRPIRLSYQKGQMQIFLLKPDGNIEKEITNQYF